MSTLTLTTTPKSGLRPVNMRQDLAQIADLIELCFADNMDRAGRAAVQEMRFMSRLGPGLWLIQGLDRMLRGLMQGYVWVEDGYVVGNISIYPAGYARTWVIANVAVHPDHRNRGIGRQLCEAALQRVLGWRGQTAVLQVDADNETAQRLYKRLGFYVERTFTRWHWSSGSRPPDPLDNMPHITYPSMREWRAVHALAETTRPNQRGGLGWLRPLDESRFRPSLGRALGVLLSPSSRERWIVRGDNGRIDGLVMTEVGFGSSSLMFDLLIHPQRAGDLESPLINYTLRRAADQFRGASTDHPSDDFIAAEILAGYGFREKRSLIHMRWDGV